MGAEKDYFASASDNLNLPTHLRISHQHYNHRIYHENKSPEIPQSGAAGIRFTHLQHHKRHGNTHATTPFSPHQASPTPPYILVHNLGPRVCCGLQQRPGCPGECRRPGHAHCGGRAQDHFAYAVVTPYVEGCTHETRKSQIDKCVQARSSFRRRSAAGRLGDLGGLFAAGS